VPVHFRFRKVELISHDKYVPSDFEPESIEKFKYQLSVRYKNDNTGQIIITLTYVLFFNDILVFSMSTENIFDVPEDDLKKYKNVIMVDKKFVRELTELSLYHSRGIQAALINDTPLESFYIPYVPQSKFFADTEKENFATA